MTIRHINKRLMSDAAVAVAIGIWGCLLYSVPAVAADRNGASTIWMGDTTGSYATMGQFDSSLITFDSVGTSIQVSFAAQPAPPQYGLTASVLADASAPGSLFIGDYTASGAKSVSFRIKGDGHVPLSLGVVLNSKAGNRKWLCTDGLTVRPVAGQWTTNSVSFDQVVFSQAGGWVLWVYSYGSWIPDYEKSAAELAALWKADLRDVGAIGVKLSQSGGDAQSYTIDQFRLSGASGFITPPAKLSPFLVCVIEQGPQGATLKWECKAGSAYTVTRSQNLLGGFTTLEDPNARDIVATETGYMTYTDKTATGEGPYFYRVVGR